MENQQTVDVLSKVSAVIALFSAIFAFSQARYAKRVYKLQKELFEASKANIVIQEIENSFIFNAKNETSIYYFFKIVLSNLSDRPNSINKIFLELEYSSNSTLIINYQDFTNIHPDLIRLAIPNNIDSHSSTSGWVVFEIKKNIYKTLDINTHYIVIEDIHGINIRKEEIYVREEVIGFEL